MSISHDPRFSRQGRLDSADQWHSIAESAYRQLTAKRAEFFTTTFVFLECGNAAARRPY